MQLLMQELRNRQDPEEREFKNIAVWQPDSDMELPAEFLQIYPEEMWRERSPEYFMERIDGPYTILAARPDDEEIETIETDAEPPADLSDESLQE